MYRTSLLLLALATIALTTASKPQSDDQDDLLRAKQEVSMRAKRALSNSRTADYYELIMVLVVLAVIIVVSIVVAWACCGCSCLKQLR